MADYDVIVIGSGIGGLITAGILSSGGLSTLVVERQKTPGGYLASFRRKKFVFDSAVDCISGVAPEGLIFQVLRLLGVEKEIEFVRVDPIRVSMFPGIDVPVDADLEAYIDRLSQLFPGESGGIRKFFDTASRLFELIQPRAGVLAPGVIELSSISPDVLRLMRLTGRDLLDECLTDHRLKAILSDRCPFIGLPPSAVSLVSMVATTMSYFALGAFRAVGGFQKLADALVAGIEKKGGSIVLGNGVRRIILENQACRGVVCDDDAMYTCRYLVSNADFNHTFSSLLPEKYGMIAEEMNRQVGVSTSFVIVYAGIRGDITTHSSVGYFPSFDMESLLGTGTAAGDDSTIGITVASLEDRTRAPLGCHTVVLHALMDGSSGIPVNKAEYAELLLKKAEKVMPGIKDSIDVLDSATPLTLQRYTGNYHGAAFGWRQIPRLRNATKHDIANLYVAGHWGDAGGGVLAAACSGAKAASEILRKEGLSIVL